MKLITIEDYDQAIKYIEEAKTQLAPDGNCCAICGDNDHQAFECRLNPVIALRKAEGYKCFHCGEFFLDPCAARGHFGDTEYEQAKCLSSGADRLAFECARQIQLGRIDSRSGIGDALLDYLKIGCPGGPDSVPGWMAEYEESKKK